MQNPPKNICLTLSIVRSTRGPKQDTFRGPVWSPAIFHNQMAHHCILTNLVQTLCKSSTTQLTQVTASDSWAISAKNHPHILRSGWNLVTAMRWFMVAWPCWPYGAKVYARASHWQSVHLTRKHSWQQFLLFALYIFFPFYFNSVL